MEISTTRRNFVKLSAAAGGAVSFGFAPKLFAVNENPKPLRILILGGTGFTGPAQVRYALGRGHKVTVFNRGKTHRNELPEGVEQLIGERNGQLEALKGKTWDVGRGDRQSDHAAGMGARRGGNLERERRSLRFYLDDFGVRRQQQAGNG